MEYPDHFLRLINHFQTLPTVGRKSAERLAFHVLKMEQEQLDEFSLSINSIHSHIRTCERCFNMTEQETCIICQNKNRDTTKICVVESVQDLIAIENSMEYPGLYFVLNGTIDLAKPDSVQKINLHFLVQRVVEENITEVILATNPTLQGETTALYISRLLETQPQVIITRLASGLPIGANVEYADQLTLAKALEGRRQIK